MPASGDYVSCDSRQMTLLTTTKGQPEKLAAIDFTACFSEGKPAFRTDGVAKVAVMGKGVERATLRLVGPAADQASVVCDIDQSDPQRVRLIWRIDYHGPVQRFASWGTGLHFVFPTAAAGARPKSMLRWVSPDGSKPWEVAGDTPYPVLDRYLHVVEFPSRRLVMATNWYDNDWFYGRNLDRISTIHVNIPAEKPQQATALVDIVATQAPRSDAELLAISLGEPVSIELETGRSANLFAPGEPLRLVAQCRNVTSAPRAARFAWQLHDHDGKCVSAGDEKLALSPGGDWSKDLAAAKTAAPGMYFLAGELSWPAGHRLVRTALGVLPPREAKLRPQSPFGISGIICNDRAYPDQPAMETVLALCTRIGVHWMRALQFPLRESVDAQEVRSHRQQWEAFRRHGITAHVQCADPFVMDPHGRQRFERQFAASLPAFAFLSPCFEVGNELNLGDQLKAADYVERLLRPQYDVMRRIAPNAKVATMGFGGVDATWWKEFVRAGGLKCCDVISIHPGHQPRAPEYSQWGGWEFPPQLRRVFDSLEKAGLTAKREVWISEAYAPSDPKRSYVDCRTAADYLVREYCVSLALGVRLIEWYQLQDGVWFATVPNPEDTEYSYGMVYTDLTPKPQLVAYGVMTAELEGARCMGRLDLGADDLYGVRFCKGETTVDVLWSYREKDECDCDWWPPEKFRNQHRRPGEPWQPRWRQPVSISLPAVGEVVVTDVLGRSQRMRGQGAAVHLSLSGSPLYVQGLATIPVRKRVW